MMFFVKKRENVPKKKGQTEVTCSGSLIEVFSLLVFGVFLCFFFWSFFGLFLYKKRKKKREKKRNIKKQTKKLVSKNNEFVFYKVKNTTKNRKVKPIKNKKFIGERKWEKEGAVQIAGMVKLVDTPGLGPGALCHAGSSPAARKNESFSI